MHMGYVLSSFDVEETVQNKVYQFRLNIPNREPYVDELAIMISDVPKSYRDQVCQKIIEAFRRT